MSLHLAATLLLPLLAAGDPFAGKKLALVVGNDQFVDPAWPVLKYPSKDARDVTRALGAFDRIERAGEDATVTAGELKSALKTLALANTNDLDTVVIYISTHGTLARDEKGELARVLVLHDTTHEDAFHTGLPYDELVKELRGLRSKYKLLIIAACNSGAGKSMLSETLVRELKSIKAPFFAEPAPYDGEGQMIVAASAWGEPAREDDALENDIYTHFFVEALNGFDRNGDGAVTALEAHDYARLRTLEFTRGKQHPSLTAELVGDAPIVLSGRIQRRGDPVVAAYSARFNGATLFVDGREKGALPGGFVVGSGERTIRVIRPGATDAIIDQTVEVESGGVLLLDSLLATEREGRFTIGPDLRWRFIRGEQNHLGEGVLFGARGSYQNANRWWRAGVAIGGTSDDRGIDLRARHLVESSWYVNAAGTFALEVLDGAVALEAQLGWAIGERRVGAEEPKFVAYPFAGIAAEATWWFESRVGIRGTIGVDLLFPRIEGRARVLGSDHYGAGVVIAW